MTAIRAASLLLCGFLSACYGALPPPPGGGASSDWAWIGGPNVTNSAGTYGTQGVPAPSNLPGARHGASSWTDAAGAFWLFGGRVSTGPFSENMMNDLWRFDGTNWTWVSGSGSTNPPWSYGTRGVPAASNLPPPREYAASWTDPSGNFWLFGCASPSMRNDLWKFDGTNWTWVSGSDLVGQPGIYVTKGSPAALNVPGARSGAATWTDAAGNLWMFGGSGQDLAGSGGLLADLWKFDGTNWTWVTGANWSSVPGNYGTRGRPSPDNFPGARERAVTWHDAAGNLWLFGGLGRGSAGNAGFLNDLWKFDGAAWTWVSGADTVNWTGIYGTKGVPGDLNVPGGRYGAVSWNDAAGHLWLFGGFGRDSTGLQGSFNDLWRFDGTRWTWLAGTNRVNRPGVYGTPGTPGGRSGSVSWRSGNGLWLFGGLGYGVTFTPGNLNDLWRYALDPAAVPGPPPAPTGLVAAAGNGSVQLTWDASVGATSYTVHRGTASGGETPLASSPGLMHVDAGPLANGTTYFYTVTAAGPSGMSGPSAEASATPSASLPAAPVLAATPGNHQVALSWTATGTTYQVYRSWIPGGPYAAIGGPVSATTATDAGLVNGRTYSYIVVATNAGGSSVASNEASATPAGSTPLPVWTWMSGPATVNQAPVHGTKGVPAAANRPGGRSAACSWRDGAGNFWLFGGRGYDGAGTRGYWNDLWRFDGTNWTWISGGTTIGETPTWGTKGVPAAANVPGPRDSAVSWTDGSGNLWLFGGLAGWASGDLNDLWRFDGTNWTWISGSNTTGQFGVYGTQGVPAAANVPGARDNAVSCIGAGNALWLFGGERNDRIENFNDLWRFDGANWTWISGSSAPNQFGVYGTRGVPAPGNVPGARYGSSSWMDLSGAFWLFGGYGYFPPGSSTGFFNDLWRFDGVQWTWISGTGAAPQIGSYGVQGVPVASNVPGSRANAAAWTDPAGNLWLFGGGGYDSVAGPRIINDLWKFDGTNWAWMSGANTVMQIGTYGTQGVPAPGNVPGARNSGATWTDGAGNLWLLGGSGPDAAGTWGILGDLWRCSP